MVKLIKCLLCLWIGLNLAIAAGFESAEWDFYRLTDPAKTLRSVKVATKGGIELIGYSIGEEARFEKHSRDMWDFFSDERILATWGGINAKTDTTESFQAALSRYRERAKNNLLSWRLYYNKDEHLLSVAGSYLPIGNGSQYDGGAEIVCCTHSDYWRHGVGRAAVSSYISADMMRSPFSYVWSSAKPTNIASSDGVLSGGFEPWELNLEDPLLPSHMKRMDRKFFRMDRTKLEKGTLLPFEWLEK
jgi:hypothetical protein